jgi:hypothetical protein
MPSERVRHAEHVIVQNTLFWAGRLLGFTTGPAW